MIKLEQHYQHACT